MKNLIFRQLFDEDTWTYTYILGDTKSKKCLIIDPVLGQTHRDTKLIQELWLSLEYIFDTHIHADHITWSGTLRNSTHAKIVLWEATQLTSADILMKDGETIQCGDIHIQAIATPWHTSGCTSFYTENMLFTGDTLLIRKTGRTDFQWGSSKDLFHSIQQKIYTLPNDTLIYPWHDYDGYTMSTIKEEKEYNTRISHSTSIQEFQKILDNLNLPYPKYIDTALPANQKLWLEK